jgi:hypothetical protein
MDSCLRYSSSKSNLFCPEYKPQAKVFLQLQQYLTGLDSLIGSVCAAYIIEVDVPGGIDIRVVFVERSETSDGPQSGPVLDLSSIASSERCWNQIFSLSNTTSKDLATSLIHALGQDQDSTGKHASRYRQS